MTDETSQLDDDPLDDNVISACVLRSVGTERPEFWDYLNFSWENYGPVQVSVDYASLLHRTITHDVLEDYGCEVVIMEDARNPGRDHVFSTTEIYEINKYTRSGHGLIVTGGTLRRSEHGGLAGVLGYKENALGHVYYGSYKRDSIQVLLPDHPLMTNLPSYNTGSEHFYSMFARYSGVNDRWEESAEKWNEFSAQDHIDIVARIWNQRVWTGMLSTVITAHTTDNYKTVFAGHSPTIDAHTLDDYQFYYNAIVFTASR